MPIGELSIDETEKKRLNTVNITFYYKIVDYPEWIRVDRLIECLKCVAVSNHTKTHTHTHLYILESIGFINWVFIRAYVIKYRTEK